MKVTPKYYSFTEAVELAMTTLKINRSDAKALIRTAMAKGELAFAVEDPETGDLDPGRPAEAEHCNDQGIIDADWPRKHQ